MARAHFRSFAAPRQWTALLAALLLAPLLSHAQRPRTQTELLIDLAREATVGRKDVGPLQISTARVFLRAAHRHDPASVDAIAALVELESLTDNEPAIAPLIDALIQADPSNDVVFSRWLQKGPPGPQTRESLGNWLTGIADSSRPPSQRALAKVRIAGLATERLDADGARRLVQQAIELCPDCAEPREAMLSLLPAAAAASERLSAILNVLRTDPAAVEAAWQGAFLLDQMGFWADAQMLYEHAFRQHGRRHPGQPVPYACFLRAAENAFARNQRDAAAALMSSAVLHGGLDLENAPTTIWLLSRVGPSEQLVPVRKRINDLAAEVAKAVDLHSGETCAQAAFALCVVAPENSAIEPLAAAAVKKTPESLLAQRVLGWSHAIANRDAEAVAVFSRIAAADAFAAAKLAALHKKLGNEEAAKRVVAELKEPPLFGLAHEMLGRVGLEPPSSQPTEQHPEIVKILKEFDRGVFEFDADPGRFIDVAMDIETLNPGSGEPWRATFSITSKAAFPIPLGRDGLVSPVFLVFFRIEADRSRDYPALFAVTFDRWRTLAPGVTLKVSRTLDVGPLRAISRRFPQMPLRVSMQSIFDPVMAADGRWIAGSSGRELRLQSLSRNPAVASPEGIAALLESAAKGFPAARFLALETLGDLLGEQQRYEAEKLSYVPQWQFDAGPVADALRRALSNESWETRVRALDALYSAGFDAATVEAIRVAGRDANWIARLLAVRLMGRQPGAFADDLRRIADSDGDELVRELARTILVAASSEKPAVSQPATPK